MAQSLVAKPVEPAGEGVVVRWRKWGAAVDTVDSGYTYASIKGADNPGGALWYTTQDPRRAGGNKIVPLPWDDLLEKIGERSWPTLELLD